MKPILVMATIWRTKPELINMTYDSDTLREAIEYRRFDSKRARKETHRLTDLDTDKQRWTTDLGRRTDDLEGKAVIDKAWKAAIAEIEAALSRDEYNSNYARAHYYARAS